MEAIGEAGYILSRPELICLAALTGTDIMLGVTDNTSLLSKDEILELWPGIKDSLHDKQYVLEDTDGTLKIDERLFQCVSICAKPRVYISCSRWREPGSEQFSCYVDYGACVKLAESKSIKDTFVLTPFTMYLGIRNMFLDFFVPEGDYKSGGKPVLFTKDKLEEIQSAIGTEPVADVDGRETAEKVLHSEKSPYSLIKMKLDNAGVSRTSAYTVYIGENTIWYGRAVKGAEGLTTLEPINKGKLISDIFEQANTLKYFFKEKAASHQTQV